MELNMSWGANSCLSSQEIDSILWHSKVHYYVHELTISPYSAPEFFRWPCRSYAICIPGEYTDICIFDLEMVCLNVQKLKELLSFVTFSGDLKHVYGFQPLHSWQPPQ
jgi:hypothetical protein